MAIASSSRPSHAAPALAVVAFVVGGFAGGGATNPGAESCPQAAPEVQPMAAVSWPPSSGLLVSEVVTGGASASDEFVEIYNASGETVDLAGLEIVYATSTGSTVTRKQTWIAFPLAAHAHLLLSNSAGIFAAGADGLYSGGFSATGGSLVLRVVGGATIDSLSWGDASSALVEGTPGLAPAAQFSLERLPGGTQGNAVDSNDNVADTWINSTPEPQSTASEPVPGESPAPSLATTAQPTALPTESATVTAEPTPEPTAQLSSAPDTTLEPTQEATAQPSPTAAVTPPPTTFCTPAPSTIPSPTLQPTATPTATPSRTATVSPSPSPTAAPTVSPTSQPTLTVAPIAAARTQALGTRVVVRGVVTVAPGWILGELTTAIQDDTAGIYVKLPQMSIDGIVPGRVLQVDGVLAAPYGNLEIRPTSAGVQLLQTATPPAPLALTVSQLGESTEGLLGHVDGTLRRIEGTGVTSLTLIVEDATGEGRVFLHATLGVSRDDFAVGQRIRVTGLVGDRLGLYRIWPRNKFDIAVTDPDPTSRHSATPRPQPTPRPHPTPRPTPTRTPSPSSRPSHVPAAISISDALRRIGQEVTIEGVATTRNGLLDADGQRVAVQDATGAILVRLPEGVTAQPGQRLRVSGEVGTYYNAPQLTATVAARLGDTNVQPFMVRAAPVPSALEWRLVVLSGNVESVQRDGDTWRAELTISGGGIPIVGLSRSGIASTALIEGRDATVTGIVKRAYPTASDQRFAVVPRLAADIKLGQEPASGAGPGATSAGQDDGSGLPWLASMDPSDGQFSGTSTPSGYSTSQQARSVPLAELASYLGMRVGVGGEIVAIQAGRVSIDDGTGVATVVARAQAADALVAASLGDLLNATGLVAEAADGAFEIIVEDPLALTWFDLTRASVGASIAAVSTANAMAAGATDATGTSGTANDPRMVAIGLLALALSAVGVTLLASPARRQRVRAWLAEAGVALKQRLAALRVS